MPRGDDPSHKYDKERHRLKDSDLQDPERKAVLDFLEAYHPETGSSGNLSYNSLEGYGRALRLIAKESDCSLLEHTTDSLQSVFQEWLDNGMAKQTVRQRQAASRKFYRFQQIEQVQPDDIPLTAKGDTSVDEGDMFTKKEVHKLREACSNTRDRCLIELLLYTGQRIRAIQTLRLKDIDLPEGVYYLNTKEEGLKGADKSGKKRPLLGATSAVREWMNHHPTGEPEDYLITTLPSATRGNEGDYLSAPAIRDRLKRIGEEAEINKPINAHNFRHYFVTVCHREYDMDDAIIKHLIGHSPDSVVMEKTYSHLTDEDHINHTRKAAEGVGKEAEEDKGSLTPDMCPTCDENLPPSAKACPACGMVFTPDANLTQEQIEDDMYEAEKEVQMEREEAVEKIRDLIEEHPGLLEEVTKY
jgi:integrase